LPRTGAIPGTDQRGEQQRRKKRPGHCMTSEGRTRWLQTTAANTLHLVGGSHRRLAAAEPGREPPTARSPRYYPTPTTPASRFPHRWAQLAARHRSQSGRPGRRTPPATEASRCGRGPAPPCARGPHPPCAAGAAGTPAHRQPPRTWTPGASSPRWRRGPAS
jgi:hypothetical protein